MFGCYAISTFMTPPGRHRKRKEIFSVNEQPDSAPLVRELRKRLRLTADLLEQTEQAARLGKLIWANLGDIGYGE